jgi:ABC-type transport system involved in multi-copper enzyme maturation permease subunit
MVIVSIAFVRAGMREGERSIWNKVREIFASTGDQDRRRRPRRVWRNPIAWREAATRASAGGRSILRWIFLIGGVAVGFGLLVGHYSGWGPLAATNPAVTRQWLTVLTWIELAVMLLVVTNTAASTLTREKESLTIELLLSTPLTSQYIVAGMLRGLVSFALPLIAVPTSTLLLFVLAGGLTVGRYPMVVEPESVLLLPLLMTAYSAMAAIIGLQFSLVSRTTVRAIMLSTAAVLSAAGLLWVCGIALQDSGAVVIAAVYPLTPFPAVQALVDAPAIFNPQGNVGTDTLQTARVMRILSSAISAAVYLAITFSIYRNMVRGFDMTVRKQTR